MIAIDGFYFDGRSSARRAVQITFKNDATVHVTGAGIDVRHRYHDVRISARLGVSTRYLHFPDGATCESADNDAVDRAVERFGGHERARLLHRMESRLGYAAAALAIVIAIGWFFAAYGIPRLALYIAHAVPPEVELTMGEDAMRTLDEHFLEPSSLSPARRMALREGFEDMAKTLAIAPPPRIEFRASPTFGPNAFALPSGIVVLTDELAALAQDDRELEAVLAHELGHVHHRHIMRHLLQGSIAVLLIAAALGDPGLIGAIEASVPALLLERQYSRAFELEADAYAAQYLRRRGLSTTWLAQILRRLTEEHGAAQEGAIMGYLSSHPATSERIRALE